MDLQWGRGHPAILLVDERQSDGIPGGASGVHSSDGALYQTENYFLVHAGAPAGQALAQSVEDPEARHTFLWGRNHINAPVTPWENIPVSSSRYLRSVRMSI